MIMRTFLEVFPEASLWGAVEYPGFFLIGGHRSFAQTPAELQKVTEWLRHVEDLGTSNQGYRNLSVLSRLYLLDAEGLARLVGDAPVVTDDQPYTEFPLWRWVFDPAGRRILNADQVRDRSSAVWQGK